MTEAHTQRAHAKLAPSAAHRWAHCPGSIKLSEGIPNTSSIFAAEGTAAHELCAHSLETGDDPATFLSMWVDIHADDSGKRFLNLDEAPEGEDVKRFFEITDEMVESVALYVDHVRDLVGPEDLLSVEQRLDMTHLHPQIFGTGDASVMQTEAKHLHVVDFKYGKGVAVDADDNPQLLLYAAGAARRHHNHAVDNLTVHIVQPRAQFKIPGDWMLDENDIFRSRDGRSGANRKGTIRWFQIDLIGLLEFEDDVKAAAEKTEVAAKAFDQASIVPWADTYLSAGDWCRFCPAQGLCPTARKSNLAKAAAEFGDIGEDLTLTEPEMLTEAQLGAVLREADSILNWTKAVQEFAHAQACHGKMPAGFKLVAKRATRKWKDADAVREQLEVIGVSETDMMTEPKLRTPAQLEKFFPGKNKDQRQAAMGDLVEKVSSGTNLVPAGDPRPPVNLGAAAEFDRIELAE